MITKIKVIGLLMNVKKKKVFTRLILTAVSEVNVAVVSEAFHWQRSQTSV